MKKDLVIGIVGAAILVAAMVGVFRYEAGRAGDAFQVTWDEITSPGPSTPGQTAESAKTEGTVNITQANLTALLFVLTWTDDNPQSAPDEFELIVITPEGESQTATGDEGTLSVAFEGLSARPTITTVTARSASDGEAALAQTYTSTSGTGTWSFVVRLINAGDQNAPIVGAPITPDTGNPWTLNVEQTSYKPNLAR